MEIIGKISKGSKMDQIYISKQRVPGFEVGESVLITPIKGLRKIKVSKYYFNVKNIEPIKNVIIDYIFNYLTNFDNVIISGSILEKGNFFNDIDIIILNEKIVDLTKIKSNLEKIIGMKVHLICMTNSDLVIGYNTDPLFQVLLSKFISKERIIVKHNKKLNYKLLDLYLIESKLLIDNFELLSGREKYRLVRNLFGVKLFLENKVLSLSLINESIEKYFGKDSVEKIKENLIEKKYFIEIYKKVYNDLFERIMEGIKRG